MKEVIKRTGPIQESLVYLDDLTGLYNRRYLKIAQKEIEELREKDIPFSLVIVDIDHFKEINDTYGHLKGDQIIKDFAQFLKSSVRTTDTVIRYGGDEFVCVMSNTKQSETRYIYDRILDRCRKRKFAELEIMISAGVASYPTDGEDFEALLRIADESLYDAKRSGRGQIGGTRKKRIELPTNTFIGRREEIEVLRQLITEESSTIRAAIIEGNIGIGKTRLVKEVLSSISGQEIIWSDCLAFFDGIPYYPIREIIKYKINRQGKKIIENIPLAYRIELGKLLPELMEDVKEKVLEVGLVLDKYRLYESVRMIIEIGTSKKVIVIDNMQWTDQETTESIKYLLRSLKNLPITFLFVYRQEEKTQILEDFTSYISRDTKVKKLDLKPLEPKNVKEMLKLIIGETPEKELAGYIEQWSGGNPFYIEEIVKGLSDAGYLRVDGDQWQFKKPVAEIIPKSIEDITERKYQGLSNEGKEILEIASVIGGFDIDILKAITGYNEGHIIGVIETIKKLGLINEHDDRIEFQDELSRNTIYQRKVGGAKGRMYHKKIGEKLEEQHRGRENEVLEELAFHYYRGGDKEKGMRYCIEAGDRVKEKYANSSAINYYTWAEELLRDQNDIESKRNRIDCLIKRADVLSFIGNNDGALRDLETGLQEAKDIGDKKREVDTRFRIASIYVNVSKFPKAIDEANECIKLYSEIGDKKGNAKALNAIGNTQGFLGKYQEALKNYEASLKICRNTGDKYFEGRLLNNIGLTYMNLGEYDRSLQNFEASLKVKLATGDKYREGAALNNIGLIYMSSGDYNEALKNFQDSLKIFREIGNKYGEALVLNNVGIIYNNWGNYDKGLKYSEDALKIATDTENRYCEALTLHNIGNIYMNWGDHGQALKYFENALKTAENTKSHEQLFNALLSLGYLYLNTNKFEKAKEFIDKAYHKARDLNLERNLKEALSASCEFYLEQKNCTECKKTLKVLENFYKEAQSKAFEGKIKLLQGRYHTETKDFAKASKFLKTALKIFDEMAEQLNVGIVYYYVGILELAKMNKSAGKKNLRKALVIFNSLTAKGWQDKVKKSLKKSVPKKPK